MRLDTSTRTETNMDSETMGFDPESAAVLADILSGLYTNPHEAVVREYAANGIDAHEAAGVTRPVEITLPDDFNPQLIIRDYGIGMTTREARRLFARYGASNKRGTLKERVTGDYSEEVNRMIGGYGIGSKSAFAIADVLTVETIKDGTLTRLTAVRTEDGPSITGTHTESTDAPSGTTVTIPVDPRQDWERHAAHALAFTNGAVTIAGEAPTDPRGEAPADGHPTVAPMDPRDLTFNGTPRVVMGGMSYAIPSSISEELYKHLAGGVPVIEAPIGTVRLSPSRESILDTKANAKLLIDYVKTTWLNAAEQKMLGKTPWQTLVNVGDAQLVPANVNDHLSKLSSITHYRDERYTAVSVIYDSKRESLGGRNSFGTALNEIRRTEKDRLVFVDWESKSSPKLRRWLWDHSDFEFESASRAVAIIAPADDLGQIAEAGFTVMDREKISNYKPTRPLPKKPKTDVQYPVTDVHGNVEWMAPDEIGQRFEKIAFGNEYNQDSYRLRVGYEAGHRTLVALKHSHGENIGVVQTSYRQTTEAAERRIGLQRVSVRQAEEAYVLDQFQALTTEEQHVMTILYGDRFASGPYEFDRIPYGVQRRISERQQIISATREVAQAHDLDLPGDFDEAERLATMLTDSSPMEGLRKKIAAKGEDPSLWLATMAPMIHTVASGVTAWPEQTEAFVREVSVVPEGRRQRAMIAGLLMIGPQEEES